MSAFAGRIEMTSEQVRWRLKRENSASGAPATSGRAEEPA
jgi:hypothetical protein